jgi:hypothetical protein
MLKRSRYFQNELFNTIIVIYSMIFLHILTSLPFPSYSFIFLHFHSFSIFRSFIHLHSFIFISVQEPPVGKLTGVSLSARRVDHLRSFRSCHEEIHRAKRRQLHSQSHGYKNILLLFCLCLEQHYESDTPGQKTTTLFSITWVQKGFVIVALMFRTTL